MKLAGYLALDLCDTELITEGPDGAILKWIHQMTGFFSEEIEREVIPMATILDAVYRSLSARKHDNLIRFLVGGVTYYDDLEAKPNDLDDSLKLIPAEAAAEADRFQLIVEEEDDDERLYVVLNVLVYRKHLPGTYPVWIRATAIEKDLLRQDKEDGEAYIARIKDIFQKPEALVVRTQKSAETLLEMLEALKQEFEKHLSVKDTFQGVKPEFHISPDDYFFSLRPEYWDVVELVRSLAEEHDIYEHFEDDEVETLSEFVEEHEEQIETFESKLLPEGTRGVATHGAKSWTAFSKRHVYNPKTGNIVQIRSLNKDAQMPYRLLFNRGVPDDQHIRIAGWWERMWGKVSRGWSRQMDRDMKHFQEHSPNTYAFMTDDEFRKKVFLHSGKLLGQEMADTAEVFAYTLVRELYEVGRFPFDYYAANRSLTTALDVQRGDRALNQFFDFIELAVGTIVPVGGFAVGGPLGGAIGLAGIKIFQKALNWSSKRKGGREWTILPSAWHERAKVVKEKRAISRAEVKKDFNEHADDIVTRSKEEEEAILEMAARELAENLKAFGRSVEDGELVIDEELLDVSTLKEQDIDLALKEEEKVTQTQKTAETK